MPEKIYKTIHFFFVLMIKNVKHKQKKKKRKLYKKIMHKYKKLTGAFGCSFLVPSIFVTSKESIPFKCFASRLYFGSSS